MARSSPASRPSPASSFDRRCHSFLASSPRQAGQGGTLAAGSGSAAEIAREAERCAAAGASVLYLHVRDEDGRHSLAPRHYRSAIAAVRNALGDDLVIQITTEVAGRYGPDAQMATVRDLHPDAVSWAARS
jgi:beta-keto acid cleavage enzyme